MKILVGLGLAVVGCSSSSLPTYRDYALALDAQNCNRQYACCTPEQVQKFTYPDEASCVSGEDAEFDEFLRADIEDRIARGLDRYDADAAQRCLDNQAAATADCGAAWHQIDPTSDICRQVLIGTETAGQNCGAVSACAPGLWCNSLSSDAVCVATLQAGDSCSILSQPEPTPCPIGLACLTSPDQTAMCGEPRDVGAFCLISSDCASQRCDQSASICVAVTATVANVICGG